MSTYSQFINSHPKNFINKAQEIIKHDYPEYEPFMNDFLSGNKLYLCLNFVMKTELFDDWCKWIFDILFKLEKEIDLTVYNEYHTVRGPAFLAERFFNVWLLYQIKTKNIKILNRQSYILETLNSKTFNFLIGKYVTDKKRRIINILGLKLTIKK